MFTDTASCLYSQFHCYFFDFFQQSLVGKIVCAVQFIFVQGSFCFMNSYTQRSQSGKVADSEFLLLPDLLSLNLRTLSQGGALHTDSDNVSVGAITLSSVVLCTDERIFSD